MQASRLHYGHNLSMPSEIDNYWAATTHPWACVLFVLPLLAIYEIGLYVAGVPEETARNGADVWLRAALGQIGVSPIYGAPLILLGVQIGSLLAAYAPGANPEIIGPFRPAAYIGAYAFIALTNAFIAATVQFSAALVSGRPIASYVGSMGLFFLSVGMGIDLRALVAEPLWTPLSVVGLILIKAVVIIVLLRAFGLSWGRATEGGLLLGQGSEFAFIVIGLENYLAQLGAWVTVVQGAIFVVCVLTFRRGIVGELARLLRRPL